MSSFWDQATQAVPEGFSLGWRDMQQRIARKRAEELQQKEAEDALRAQQIEADKARILAARDARLTEANANQVRRQGLGVQFDPATSEAFAGLPTQHARLLEMAFTQAQTPEAKLKVVQTAQSLKDKLSKPAKPVQSKKPTQAEIMGGMLKSAKTMIGRGVPFEQVIQMVPMEYAPKLTAMRKYLDPQGFKAAQESADYEKQMQKAEIDFQKMQDANTTNGIQIDSSLPQTLAEYLSKYGARYPAVVQKIIKNTPLTGGNVGQGLQNTGGAATTQNILGAQPTPAPPSNAQADSSAMVNSLQQQIQAEEERGRQIDAELEQLKKELGR